MNLRRLACATVCALAGLGGGAAAAQACTDTWTGAHSNLWGDAQNWSNGNVPGGASQTEDVCLPSAALNYPVTLQAWVYAPIVPMVVGDTVIHDLTISSGASLLVNGSSYQDQGNISHQQIELTLNGTGTIATGGSLELDSTHAGSITSGNGQGGFATIDGGGTLTNNGTFQSVNVSTPNPAALQNTLGVAMVNDAIATVASGTLHLDREENVTNNGTWSTSPGATMQLEYNGFNDHGTATSFTNNANYVNDGQTVMAQRDTARVGNSFDNPITWFQNGGAVTGANPIQVQGGAELNDSAGTGSFILNQIEEHLVGTIPAGQTVEVQGNQYALSNGDPANDNRVTLGGTSVVNHGTLILDTPSASNGTGPVLLGAPLDNEGTVNVVSESTTGLAEFDNTVTNNGTLNVQSGKLLFTDGNTDTNNGTFTIAPTSNATVNANSFFSGATTFVNHGTIVPQFTASSGAQLILGPSANATLGGTVSPQGIGGYLPPIGNEQQTFPLRGVTVTGTFGAVTGGFAADYAHQKDSSQPFIGLVFNGLPANGSTGNPGTTKPGATAKHPSALALHKPSVKGLRVRLLLSCSKGKGCKKATVAATAHVKVKTKKGKTRTEAVVVEKGSATLKAGAKRMVALKLTRAGRKLLARRHTLAVKVMVAVGGKTRRTFRVTLHAAHGKHHTMGSKHHKKH